MEPTDHTSLCVWNQCFFAKEYVIETGNRTIIFVIVDDIP